MAKPPYDYQSNQPYAVQQYNSGTGYYSGAGSASFGGTQFQLGQGAKGFDPKINLGYLDAANMITSGSRGAAGLLNQAYQDAYAHRAGAETSAYDEYASRLTGQASAQGLSGDVIQRMLAGAGAESIRGQGAARAELGGGYYDDMAELTKGTATELSNLKLSELETALNALLAYKGRREGRRASKSSLIGGGIQGGSDLLSSFYGSSFGGGS